VSSTPMTNGDPVVVTDHLSGPGTAIDRVCVSVWRCVSVWNITFEVNDLSPRCVGCMLVRLHPDNL